MVDWVKRDVLSIWVTVMELWTYKCLVYMLPDLINTVYSFSNLLAPIWHADGVFMRP